jgi:hypothetical protein
MIYTPESYPQAREYLERLIMGEKKFELKQIREKRTLNQNNGFWLWMTYLEEQTGHTKQELHDIFLDMFPTHVEVKDFAGTRMVAITTSHPEMNTARMSTLMNHIDTYCSSELEITLPDLSEEKTRQMYEYYRERGLL